VSHATDAAGTARPNLNTGGGGGIICTDDARHASNPGNIADTADDGLGAVRGTLQLVSGPVLAALTRIDTVTDFRAADVAVGGTGAPLMPFAEDFFRRGDAKYFLALNLGGIGNVAYGIAAASPQSLRGAFDTGPANMVMDQLVSNATGGAERCDRGGERAARGEVLPSLLAWALAHPFFALDPPRSAGHEQFGTAFAAEFERRGRHETGVRAAATADRAETLDHLLATAAEFTAITVRDALLDRVAPALRGHASAGVLPDELCVRVTGGGARNTHLMRRLASLCAPSVRVCADPEDDVANGGIPSDAREAAGFAVLALAHICRVPANVPEATGASRRVILGSFSPA
jgi:anhydro-N-acetylmuramic acid kinase